MLPRQFLPYLLAVSSDTWRLQTYMGRLNLSQNQPPHTKSHCLTPSWGMWHSFCLSKHPNTGFHPAPSTLCHDSGAGEPVPLSHTTSPEGSLSPWPTTYLHWASGKQWVHPQRISWWPQSLPLAWVRITAHLRITTRFSQGVLLNPHLHQVQAPGPPVPSYPLLIIIVGWKTPAPLWS